MLRQKQNDETEKEMRARRGRQREVGVCTDLTCLGYRPVEPVNRGVPEVPIVAQISDNDLCLAMIVGDRYWQTS